MMIRGRALPGFVLQKKIPSWIRHAAALKACREWTEQIGVDFFDTRNIMFSLKKAS
jgi:hypothetical protein